MSNSEAGSRNGGVGVMRFDASGAVFGYEKVSKGTSQNSGGGAQFQVFIAMHVFHRLGPYSIYNGVGFLFLIGITYQNT